MFFPGFAARRSGCSSSSHSSSRSASSASESAPEGSGVGDVFRGRRRTRACRRSPAAEKRISENPRDADGVPRPRNGAPGGGRHGRRDRGARGPRRAAAQGLGCAPRACGALPREASEAQQRRADRPAPRGLLSRRRRDPSGTLTDRRQAARPRSDHERGRGALLEDEIQPPRRGAGGVGAGGRRRTRRSRRPARRPERPARARPGCDGRRRRRDRDLGLRDVPEARARGSDRARGQARPQAAARCRPARPG